MDSNRRFINTQDLADGSVTFIKTSTAAEIMGIVKVLDLKKVHNIIISSGTNDTDKTDVGDIVHLIVEAAEEINKIYPHLNIFVSELLPRKEYAQKETKQINEKLLNLLPRNIQIIRHQNINATHMHDDKHVSKFHLHLVVENMNKELEKYVQPQYQEQRKPQYTGLKRSFTQQPQDDSGARDEYGNNRLSRTYERRNISRREDSRANSRQPYERPPYERMPYDQRSSEGQRLRNRRPDSAEQQSHESRTVQPPHNHNANGYGHKKDRGPAVVDKKYQHWWNNDPYDYEEDDVRKDPNYKIIGKLMESLLHKNH